ncbi:hypothetical protein KCU67_g9178, partial [Aureobasidium melanogenum]
TSIMAEPPTVIDPGTDDQTSHQVPNNNLRKLIAIDQGFAKDLALEAVREIEKLWPDLIVERFASQDIIDLWNALRTGKVLLESRMLRSFLVLWKDKIGNRRRMSSQYLIDLAASIHGLVSRQLGPAGKQSSTDAMVATNRLSYPTRNEIGPPILPAAIQDNLRRGVHPGMLSYGVCSGARGAFPERRRTSRSLTLPFVAEIYPGILTDTLWYTHKYRWYEEKRTGGVRGKEFYTAKSQAI